MDHVPRHTEGAHHVFGVDVTAGGDNESAVVDRALLPLPTMTVASTPLWSSSLSFQPRSSRNNNPLQNATFATPA
jgi:hypothetical protein